MHVALSLLTLFPGRVGGSETYVRGLLKGFREIGFDELTVLGNRHVGSEFEGWPVEVVRSYRPGDSAATRFAAMNIGRLWPRLEGSRFDVVHYPVTVPVPRVEGPARVVSLLDVQHHELREMFSPGERWLRSWAYDDAARSADVVITISEHAKRGIVERLGIPDERVHAIPLGVDHERFKPDGPRREDLGDYVLYPANMWPHKNHARLLEAWQQIEDDMTLVLTGQTFGQCINQPKARHLGYVPFEDVPGLFRGARALVFPSLFEGFGVPVAEAMASGVPVATSDRGSLAEIAGEAALMFDPENVDAIAAAVRHVVHDDPLRQRLRQAGLERAARYTWRAAAEAHLRCYELAAWLS